MECRASEKLADIEDSQEKIASGLGHVSFFFSSREEALGFSIIFLFFEVGKVAGRVLGLAWNSVGFGIGLAGTIITFGSSGAAVYLALTKGFMLFSGLARVIYTPFELGASVVNSAASILFPKTSLKCFQALAKISRQWDQIEVMIDRAQIDFRPKNVDLEEIDIDHLQELKKRHIEQQSSSDSHLVQKYFPGGKMFAPEPKETYADVCADLQI